MSGQLMIPAADTQLYAVDTAGGAPAVLFLSGGFGTVQNWSRVIRRLDGKYRTVRFDARARGKSGRSADYSVHAAVDDIGRVIDATGIERPILVGWSNGATNARPCSSSAPGPTRAPPRRRCAPCALPFPTPRAATSACPYSQRRPQPHPDPQQGPRHRGRGDRGRRRQNANAR